MDYPMTSAERADMFVSGRRFFELMRASRKTWTSHGSGPDAYVQCAKHRRRWWACAKVDCQECERDAFINCRREEWEKERTAHALVSDLPFQKPAPR